MIKRFAAALLGCLLLSSAMAQTAYPTKPVTLVVPFPAGGPADVTARALALRLGKRLGQTVLVDNRPGANTMIGASLVAKAPPDGQTLLYATDATISINPLLYAKMAYQPQSDFVPLGAVMHAPEFLIVNASVPANTLQEFVNYARAKPGAINYGSIGVGSNGHLAASAIGAAIGAQFTHIPYKGAAEVVPALLNNDVQFLLLSPSLIADHLKSGKLRALGVMSRERSPLLPGVPTLSEGGLPGFESKIWFGVFAPSKTPQAITNRLSEEIGRIALDRQFIEEALTPAGMEAVPQAGPAYLSGLIAADRDKYARYVRAANVKLD